MSVSQDKIERVGKWKRRSSKRKSSLTEKKSKKKRKSSEKERDRLSVVSDKEEMEREMKMFEEQNRGMLKVVRKKRSFSSRKSKFLMRQGQNKRNLMRYYSFDSLDEYYALKLSQQRQFLNYTRNKESRESNLQKGLVDWFRKQVTDTHIPNFSSLTTGKALIDVMKQYCDELDYEYLATTPAEERLKNLFSGIEEYLDIPNNLIIKQVIQFQNSRSLILYLETFKFKIEQLKNEFNIKKKISDMNVNTKHILSDTMDLIEDLDHEIDIFKREKRQDPFSKEKNMLLAEIKNYDLVIQESVRYNILMHEENNLLKKQAEHFAKKIASLEHSVMIHEKLREVSQTKLKLIEDIRTYHEIHSTIETGDIVEDFKQTSKKEKEVRFIKQAQKRTVESVVPLSEGKNIEDIIAKSKKSKRNSSESIKRTKPIVKSKRRSLRKKETGTLQLLFTKSAKRE